MVQSSVCGCEASANVLYVGIKGTRSCPALTCVLADCNGQAHHYTPVDMQSLTFSRSVTIFSHPYRHLYWLGDERVLFRRLSMSTLPGWDAWIEEMRNLLLCLYLIDRAVQCFFLILSFLIHFSAFLYQIDQSMPGSSALPAHDGGVLLINTGVNRAGSRPHTRAALRASPLPAPASTPPPLLPRTLSHHCCAPCFPPTHLSAPL